MASAERMTRPVLTVDLEAVAANWRAFDRLGRAETAAAVKADAYGLGVEQVAPALSKAGAATFFVATAAEATTLRAVLPAVAIYVLNGPSEGLDDIVAASARPVLNSRADVEAARAFATTKGGVLDCALQVETGMNRLGLTVEEAAWTLSQAREGALSGLSVRLVMSHLAAADDPSDPLTSSQARRFDALAPGLLAAFPGARASLAATAGALLDPALHFDMIRPGVGLYGGMPFAAATPVVRLEAPILRVWEVAAGERSGYGGSWAAARRSVLATIPVGYADGLPRILSNRGEAMMRGRLVPFAGRVSMDLIVLDVTDVAADGAVAPGETVVLLDETLTIDRMAALADTIGYEILTSLGDRFERRYKPY